MQFQYVLNIPLCLMIVIFATCNTHKNTSSLDILQGDIIIKVFFCLYYNLFLFNIVIFATKNTHF